MTHQVDDEQPSRPGYGIDAPSVPALLLGACAIAVAAAIVTGAWIAWLPAIVVFGSAGGLYLHTTLRGKVRVWRRLLDREAPGTGALALDVGCGRGMVLVEVARRLPNGRAVGIDIWSARDQSGNDVGTTRRNAAGGGVEERVRLGTADMRDLPFPDGTFDLVTSNAAIHNLRTDDDRNAAVAEMWRVARPGGRLIVADIAHTSDIAEVLAALGAVDLVRTSAGWEGWYGIPFYRTTVVTATR